MNSMKCALAVALILTSSLLLPAAAQDRPRTWTASDGRTLEGIFLSATEKSVMIRRSDGRRFELPLTRLSEKDQAFVKQILSDQLRSKGLEEGPFAKKITGQWVKFPASEHGLLFQLYGDARTLKRLKEPFPLFVHLHGAASRGNDAETGKVEIAAKRLAGEEQYKKTPCLILAPTCPPDTYWGDHIGKLESVIDKLTESLPIDRNRIYLSGYSMGARGIGALLMSRPQFYAAAMFADGDANEAWVEKVDAALWMWFSGERDLKKAEAVAKAFSAAGKTAHFEGFPDMTHNQIHWKLAHDEKVFPWIFGQTRSSNSQ